jgi:AAA+ superfamily predicted ATPase
MVFAGPPGTGKTTVARYLGQILNYIGILDTGHVVEVNREDLVGEYQGHTAPKTKAKINEAIGGILFIDEAYTLSTDKQDAFGKEAINTLLAEMENKRSEFIVVVAGYPEPMRNFLDSNEGLRSRFSNTINFRDYKPEELIEIFDNLVASENYQIEQDARIAAAIYLRELYANKDKFFGNGRDVRKLFEATVKRMALRKSREKDKSPLITDRDINEAIEKLKKNIL